MTKRILIATVLAAFGLSACAATASRELLDARRAYAAAAAGPAAQTVPAELHKARESLDKAELAFNTNNPQQRDLAYVAERKAQLAVVLARRADSAALKARSEAQLAKDKAANYVQTKEELDRTRSNLVSAEQDAADQKQRAAASDSQAAMSAAQATASAAQAAEADKRAAEADLKLKAMQVELAKWAAVKEEPRGVVITLSGSVLFASNKSELLPAARNRLTQVSTALLETKERRLDVKGYTDSQGKDAYNIDLSQRRADAVRTFLVSNGYPADLVVAHGEGKAMPIADNNTAEGRANNRRVEIIIEPRPPTAKR